MRWSFFPLLPLLAQSVLAGNNVLYTNAVTYCDEAKAVIVDEFGIAYHQSNNSLTFSFSLASVESNLNVSANIYLNAYGIDVINQTIDICSYFEGVICPLPEVNFTGYGTYPVPSKYTSKIPGIAYTVPNLEAYARVELLNVDTGETAACLQATLSNGHTTRQKAVAWATGMFTLVALLIGLFHSAINSPSPAQYRWFDILYLFQTAAATGLLHLNYPLVYSNFTDNFAWAFGLFHSRAMQDSIRSMRAKTGGTLSGDAHSDVQYIDRQLSPYNEFINLNALTPSSFKTLVAERSTVSNRFQELTMIPSAIESNATTDINTGLPVYTNTFGIASANAFDTVFFWFLSFIAIAIAFHVLLFLVVWVVDHIGGGRKASWTTRLRQMWWGFCLGNALRVCLIWFLPIFIFAFWQFYIGDSGLSIFFGVFAILLVLIPLATVFIMSILRNRRSSSTAPSISPLYTSFRWFHSVGMIYRPYRQRFHYFWFAPLLIAMFVRAAFIAFGPSSAWVQVIGNVVVEFIVLIALLACRPHKDRKGDWLVSFLSFCRLCAFGLLIAFIPSVGVKAIPRTIIGLVIVVVFGVPTILLFLGLIWNLGYGYLWRRHTYRIEDGLEVERFVAADDDDSQRTAIQQADPVFMRSTNPSQKGPTLNRRTSIMEPLGDNTYEPSLSSQSHHYHNTSSQYLDPSNSPMDPAAAAYADAAAGREPGGISRATSPAVSATGRPLSGQYHSRVTSPTSPVAGGRRWSREAYQTERY